MIKICFILALIFVSFVTTKAQNQCLYWYSEVDVKVDLPDDFDEPDESDPKEIMQAIECLLKLEGNKGEAVFSGATRNEVSQTFEFATVEVAALFYISKLYYQSSNSFADAVALTENEKIDTPKTIRKAYKYYRRWFEQVKKVGLEKAREQSLDPLKGKDVSWY